MDLVFHRDRRRYRRHAVQMTAAFWITVVTVLFGLSDAEKISCEPCVCSDAGGTKLAMNCSNLGLTEVPKFLTNGSYTNVSRLYLNNNNISIIEDHAFTAGLPRLQAIHLHDNQIEYIGYRPFYHINNLNLLELNRNKLTKSSFNESAFEGLDVANLDMSHNFLSEPPRFKNVETIVNLNLHHNPMYILRTDAFTGAPLFMHSIDLSDCHLHTIEPRVFDGRKFFSLTNVFMDNNNFTKLTKSFFENARISKKLSLQNCNIQRIEAKSFKGLSRVKNLYLRRNKLGERDLIDRKAFTGLEVENLDLSYCNITWLKKNFLNISVTNELDLSHNDITIVQKDGFVGLEKVRKLVLSSCNISEIKRQPFNKLKYLEELYLNENNLDDNSLNFLGIKSRLHTLDISHNRFTSLPNITGLKKLIDLYAQSNDIQSIQSGVFNNTKELKNLRLGENHNLNYIADDALLPLKMLTVLNLGYSSLKRLPLLTNMRSLVTLEVFNSKLEELPADLCETVPLLHSLSVDGNKIAELPDLQNCSRLVIVFLDFNKITKIGKNTFSGMKHLQSILCHNNHIEEIHPNAFQDMLSLQYLNLAHNNISDLPSGLFDNLNQLSKLDLQYNSIKSLPTDIFKDLFHLQELYLNKNSIKTVGQRIFPSNMTWLQTLNISDNHQMSQFPLPKNGFPFLYSFAMQNLPLMLNVPSLSDVPRIQYIYLTYPYHCCIFRNHLPEQFLLVPTKVKSTPSEEPTDDPNNHEAHGNGTHVDLTSEHESDVTIFIVYRPSSEPLTLPPQLLLTHHFPGSQDPYNPSDHQITQEDLDEIFKNYAQHENISIRILPNNEIDIIGYEEGEAIPFGGINEDSVKRLFSHSAVFNYQSEVHCTPNPSAFMPCENLLDPNPVRVLLWTVWFPAILGNVAVIFVTMASSEKIDVPSFILCNLALADFMLGIFLSFLGVVDVRTFGGGSFYKSALHWQRSAGCKTAGFIAVFSNELSVYLMVLLTVERLHTIVYSFNQKGSRLRMRHAMILVGIGWIFATVMGLLPLFDFSSYTEVAVCLPFRTEDLKDKIYLGTIFSLNIVAFLIILFSYIHILVVYCKSPTCERKTNERYLTSFKMGILVFTNCLCWVPFSVVGLSAIAEVYFFNLTVAKYFVILVLPLNACLNPFLYTISKRTFWQRCKSICRKTDQTLQEVTSTNRFRRNSLASAASTTSSHQDIDFDLLNKRQSRRSFSLQMDGTRPTGSSRRNSLPAIFELDDRPANSEEEMTTETPLDLTLSDQLRSEIKCPTHHASRSHHKLNRNSKCLSAVQEESDSETEKDTHDLNIQSPFRFSERMLALQKANSTTNTSAMCSTQRLCVNRVDYAKRKFTPIHDEFDDYHSDCSSSCSEYDDARSSPLPPLHSMCDNNIMNTNSVNKSHRYSTMTDSCIQKTEHSSVTRIINPHTKKPVKEAMESTC